MTHEEMLAKILVIEEMLAEIRLALAREEVEKPTPPTPEPEPRSELDEIISRFQGTTVTMEMVRNTIASIGRTFTVGEIAAILSAPEHAVQRHVNEMAVTGMLTRSQANGKHGRIIEAFTYIKPRDLEPGTYEPDPTERPNGERHVEGVGADAPAGRGEPVRIRTERQMRRSLSTPGARQVHKNRERAYQRQEDAKAKRAEEQKAKAQKDPKWKRNK